MNATMKIGRNEYLELTRKIETLTLENERLKKELATLKNKAAETVKESVKVETKKGGK